MTQDEAFQLETNQPKKIIGEVLPSEEVFPSTSTVALWAGKTVMYEII